MGMTNSWDNENKTIIRYDFTAPWLWQDLLGDMAQDADMIPAPITIWGRTVRL